MRMYPLHPLVIMALGPILAGCSFKRYDIVEKIPQGETLSRKSVVYDTTTIQFHGFYI